MTTFAQALHRSLNNIATAFRYGDTGAGTSDWYANVRAAAGGIADLADIAAAVTPYPVGATPIVAASGNLAATAGAATLAAAASKRTYLTGFTITGAGASAASNITVTVTGPASTLTYIISVPSGATTPIRELSIVFPHPLPASADNTAIAVNLPSFGSGNTHASVNARGFQL